MNIPRSSYPRVVIIGGGFAGLELAKNLRKKPFQVVLIDRHNYHTFQPLLYQVATAGLEPDSIGYPLRKVIRKFQNFYFRMAEVLNVNPEKKEISTSKGPIDYDHLVIATGSTTNFFGMENVERYSLSMKTIPEALDIRSFVLQNFEQALLKTDIAEREALMNIVIVGAGPTGVELAGALAELRKHVLPQDYPDLDVRQMKIFLVESAPRVLAAMSEQSSEKALSFLQKMDVDVLLDTFVTDYDGTTVSVKDGNSISSATVIWSAGVKGNALEGIDGRSISRANRIKVNGFNRIESFDNVYAVGDVAEMSSEELERGHPMVAQVAIQQATNLAKNLCREEKDWKPFKYNDLGSMATIGRNKAVVDLPKGKFQGFFAWWIWMLVHVVQLIGFRNKLVVVMNWTYNYFKYARDIRLIIRPRKKVE